MDIDNKSECHFNKLCCLLFYAINILHIDDFKIWIIHNFNQQVISYHSDIRWLSFAPICFS